LADFLLFLHQYIDSIALLMLSAIGLVIIFGMMGVINMAHGELMMVGAYGAAYSTLAGAPLTLAILCGGVAAAIVGLSIERLVVRRFYGQLLASLVATWGLSIAISQGVLIVLGPSVRSLPMPFGTISVEGYGFAIYPLVFFAVSLGMLVGLYLLLSYTPFGLNARATMERPDMARALGINVAWIYMATFALGSFLAGVAGALFALTAPVEPTFGRAFTPIAFVVVVVAGSTHLLGGLIAAVLALALVKTVFTVEFNILMGHVGMLVAAFLVIRFAPTGLADLALLSLARVRRLAG
jgi:branched-subunit amino acid ABC-type transport system permease component